MEGVDVAEADRDKIMHVGLPIGDDAVLMASDTLQGLGQQLTQGNDVYISVHPASRQEADRIRTHVLRVMNRYGQRSVEDP